MQHEATLPVVPDRSGLFRVSSMRQLGTAVIAVIVLTSVALPIFHLFLGTLRVVRSSPDAGWTLANWTYVYGSPDYQLALLRTLLLSFVVSVLSVGLGAVMAWIVARTDAPGRRTLSILLIVPLMVPALVTTLAWVALFAPSAGFVNALVRGLFGVRTLFDAYSFSGIVIVLVLNNASFAYIAVIAALHSIDGSLEEAASVAGAGPIRTALTMTFPLLVPALVASFLAIFVFVSESFAVPGILGAPFGFDTLASRILDDMSTDPIQPNHAAVAGTMLIWLAVGGALWQRRLLMNAGMYRTIGGKGTPQRPVRLGRFRWVATAILVFYLLWAVVIPYAALLLGSFMNFVTPKITWRVLTLNNYITVLWNSDSLPILNSFLYSIVGGFATALAYISLAYLARRTETKLARFIDYSVMLPAVIPSIVLGVGFVWAYVSLPIYGTMWILMLAYFARYLGMGVRQSAAGLVQISESLSEAAQTCGASALQSFRYVVIPLLKPVFAALWTVMFIFIFIEISMTVILYTPDTQTLSVLLWSRMTGGFQTEAYAIAVIQATIVLATLLISNRLFGTLRSFVDRH